MNKENRLFLDTKAVIGKYMSEMINASPVERAIVLANEILKLSEHGIVNRCTLRSVFGTPTLDLNGKKYYRSYQWNPSGITKFIELDDFQYLDFEAIANQKLNIPKERVEQIQNYVLDATGKLSDFEREEIAKYTTTRYIRELYKMYRDEICDEIRKHEADFLTYLD